MVAAARKVDENRYRESWEAANSVAA